MDGAVSNALEAVKQSMSDMRELDLIEDVDAAIGLISAAASLQDAVSDTVYVQESVHENRDVKENVFVAMDKNAPADAILASSCSAIPPEELHCLQVGPMWFNRNGQLVG